MISGQEITPSGKKVVIQKQEPQARLQGGDVDALMCPKAVAEYSAEILAELGALADKAGLTFLAYLIQVAAEEAKIQAAEAE